MDYRTIAVAARLRSRSIAAWWMPGLVASTPNASPRVEL
jgi:hypothetical protein